jgi:hypothetical protein
LKLSTRCRIAEDSEPSRSYGEFDIILGTNGDISPANCRRMVALGWRVLILASVPRIEEEARYMAAGAADYIPMVLDGRSLEARVDDVASEPPAAPPPFRTFDPRMGLLSMGLWRAN